MTIRNEQIEATHRNLCEAFWQLYETTPLEQISVGAVAARAGYNRGTFYLHFKDIYDLLEQCETCLLNDMEACVASCMQALDTGQDPEVSLNNVLAFYESNKREIVILLGSHGDPKFVESLKTRLKPLWKRYVLHKDEGENANDLLLEYTLTGALFMISRWLENPQGVSAEKLLHLVYHAALGR